MVKLLSKMPVNTQETFKNSSANPLIKKPKFIEGENLFLITPPFNV